MSGHGDNVTAYIDNAAIQHKACSQDKMQHLCNCKTLQNIAEDKFLSEKAHDTYDCNNEQIRALTYSKFSAEAIKENNASATFLLGNGYIQALHKLLISENNKRVLLAGNLIMAVKTLVGTK